MKKTAFLTGGTGFLGLNLVELLVKDDWEIYALHRPTSDLTYLKKIPVKLVEGTITNIESLRKGIPENLDAIFHVAGDTNLWKRNNDAQYQNNVIGTRNMVTVALEKNAKRFIHTSSVSAFGMHEDIIDEHTPSNAETCGINYNKTKYLAELEVLKAVEQGLQAVIMNPCHIVGKYDKHNWSQLIKFTYNDTLPGIPKGEGMYGFAKDIAKAHITAVEKGRVGERYLLGGIRGSFLESINAVKDLLGKPKAKKTTPNWVLKLGVIVGSLQAGITGKEPQLTPEKYKIITEKSICNFDKAIKELDFQPTPLTVMVKEAFDWLKEENMLD